MHCSLSSLPISIKPLVQSSIFAFVVATQPPSVALAIQNTPCAIEIPQAVPLPSMEFAIEGTSCTPRALRWRWPEFRYIALPYGYAYAVSQATDILQIMDAGSSGRDPTVFFSLWLTRCFLLRVITIRVIAMTERFVYDLPRLVRGGDPVPAPRV